MELFESKWYLFAAPCRWVDPYIKQNGDLRYSPYEATLSIRIIFSSITCIILKEFIASQFKHWGLNAQKIPMHRITDHGGNKQKAVRKQDNHTWLICFAHAQLNKNSPKYTKEIIEFLKASI